MKTDAVCLASKVCLMRNWRDLSFPGRGDEREELCTERVASALEAEHPRYYNLGSLSPEKRNALAAKGIFSASLLQANRGGCFALPGKKLRVEVNGEDHIAIRSEYASFQLQEAYDSACRLEKQIAGTALFAYDDRFGYLTASPANAGSGFRATLLLHLPMLDEQKKIPEIASDVRKYSLRLLPEWGKEEEAPGSLFTLGNDTTMGKTDADLLTAIVQLGSSVMELEQELRRDALTHEADKLTDSCRRSFGILRYAGLLDWPEFLRHYSRLRLGSTLGILPVELSAVDELLQKANPGLYPSDEAQAALARAAKIRKCMQKLPDIDE